jgi:hypothetical protein
MIYSCRFSEFREEDEKVEEKKKTKKKKRSKGRLFVMRRRTVHDRYIGSLCNAPPRPMYRYYSL